MSSMSSILAVDEFRKDVNLFISVQRALYLLKPLLEKCRDNKEINDECSAIADAWNTLLDSRTYVVNSMMKRDVVNFADGTVDFHQ